MGLITGALGVIGAVILFVVIGTVWGVGHASGWGKHDKRLKEAERPRTYAYLDASEKLTAEQVLKVAHPYATDDVLGPYALKIEASIEQGKTRKQAILSIADAEFEKGTMTWSKFTAPVDIALEGITNNAAQIANHMQTFDSAAYQHMVRMEQAASLKATETERYALMRSTLNEMDALQSANDRLLLELERLQTELATMSGAGLDGRTSEIAEEIERLASEAKYYA